MSDFQFSSELIVSITSVVLSLVFSYFPVLRAKFASLGTEVKSVVMLGLMAAVVFAVAGLNCAGWINAGISCDQIGLKQLVWWYVMAVVSNQAAYVVSPQTGDVKIAKRLRGMVYPDA